MVELKCSDENVKKIVSILVDGIKNYAKKHNFKKAVLGISGGIDSSLTAILAVNALGNHNVVGVHMPSRFTSEESSRYAKELAKNLGITFKIFPINDVFDSYINLFSDEFRGTNQGVTEQNIQARIRANILMALSNKFDYLVLGTGNYSEIAVGYTTLYGDMAAGFCVLSHIPKTVVYKLAKHLKVIPEGILKREPSAELKHGQKDLDDISPYKILDPIVFAYMEKNMGKDEIVELGFERKTIKEIIDKIHRSKYKRLQLPPGITIPDFFELG